MYAVLNSGFSRYYSEQMDPHMLRGAVDDLEQIVAKNDIMRQRIAEKDVGKPGHYFGRDMMIEGNMPMAAFMLAPYEFGGDQNWWRDDTKFQAYMKRHPAYSYLNGR